MRILFLIIAYLCHGFGLVGLSLGVFGGENLICALSVIALMIGTVIMLVQGKKRKKVVQKPEVNVVAHLAPVIEIEKGGKDIDKTSLEIQSTKYSRDDTKNNNTGNEIEGSPFGFWAILIVGASILLLGTKLVMNSLNSQDEASANRVEFAVLKGHYENNKGVNFEKLHNYKEAFKNFKLAAEKGLPEAQYNLGRYYFLGSGVRADQEQAAYWLKKAAKQGFVEAENLLGLLENLQGGPSENDIVSAYKKSDYMEYIKMEAIPIGILYLHLKDFIIFSPSGIQSCSIIKRGTPNVVTSSRSKIPVGTTLYPIIHKLKFNIEIKDGLDADSLRKAKVLAKILQDEGFPFEMYFYEDSYGTWLTTDCAYNKEDPFSPSLKEEWAQFFKTLNERGGALSK